MEPVRLPVGTPVIYEKGKAEYHLVVGLIQAPVTGAMQAVQMGPGDNLGRYSRDLGLFPLEEAVRRMTSFPAKRMGLSDRGRIESGAPADLVLFDPETVADNTTLTLPDAPPTGIRAVLLGGKVIAQDGQVIGDERTGQVLRR